MKKNLTHFMNSACSPLILVILFILSGQAAYSYTEEDERWLNADNKSDASQVNEGTLEFILLPQYKQIFHSNNTVTIRVNSLETGWVDLQQCYYHLDKIDKIEIAYKYQSMKELIIISKRNIESVTVSG